MHYPHLLTPGVVSNESGVATIFSSVIEVRLKLYALARNQPVTLDNQFWFGSPRGDVEATTFARQQSLERFRRPDAVYSHKGIDIDRSRSGVQNCCPRPRFCRETETAAHGH